MKYIHLGREELSEFFFNPIKNQNNWIKPLGGLWCSEYREDIISNWYQWCDTENFHKEKLNNGVIFELKENAKIFVIDGYKDLLLLLEKYELKNEMSNFLTSLDFESIAKDYDAIKLTESGERETSFSVPSLYGWDIESMLIMNYDIIKNQKSFKKYWQHIYIIV